jgi:hypothetical protein
MASTSALLNTALRSRVAPILKEAGFQQVDARNGWSWRNDFIWVFNVRAVGRYFSGVTGWPPGSVGVWLGVFFEFAPRSGGLTTDEHGRLLPPEHACNMRSHVSCGLDQTRHTRSLSLRAERKRTDIWWVEPDGGNADQVASDIAKSLVAEGLPWYARASHPENALGMVEGERDCFSKFAKAALLAKYIGDEKRWRKYDALAEAEARRIGHSLDRNTWVAL